MPNRWTIFNRYTKDTEDEPIYGERWLRWAYDTSMGRLALWGLIRRKCFSVLYGWLMSRRRSRRLIGPFITQFGIDSNEMQASLNEFRCFNDFFIRKLKPDARPIAESSDGGVVFPADGRHFLLRDLDDSTELWCKGEVFSLTELLGSELLANEFRGGSAVISRLAPIDYHRFHFPLSGEANESVLIPGPLYSVHPIALAKSIRYLTSNKRMVTELSHTGAGKVIMVEIGATNVGTISQTFCPGRIETGSEKGYFAFGGSCVITVFPAGSVVFADDLAEQSTSGRELYARMGDRMGNVEAGLA